jgi:myosin heavy subunit
MEQEIDTKNSIIKRCETKNEILELKIDQLTSTSLESSSVAKKQICELKTRINNFLRVEKELRKEIEEFKKKFNEQQEMFNKEQRKMMENFKHDRQSFEDMQGKMAKKLNEQRESLKNYYQAQLEAAIEEKNKEYQKQLDKFLIELHAEAEGREKAVSERTINQMELLIRKNEEEIDLMQRKCNEEVELYRVQLLNANRLINNLELKLCEYQVRRGNNFMPIMESQLPLLQTLYPSEEEKIKTLLLRNYIDKVRSQNCF